MLTGFKILSKIMYTYPYIYIYKYIYLIEYKRHFLFTYFLLIFSNCRIDLMIFEGNWLINPL